MLKAKENGYVKEGLTIEISPKTYQYFRPGWHLVRIVNVEVQTSKTGEPVLKVWFKGRNGKEGFFVISLNNHSTGILSQLILTVFKKKISSLEIEGLVGATISIMLEVQGLHLNIVRIEDPQILEEEGGPLKAEEKWWLEGCIAYEEFPEECIREKIEDKRGKPSKRRRYRPRRSQVSDNKDYSNSPEYGYDQQDNWYKS